MTQIKDFSETFKQDKYFILQSFLTEPLLTVACKYALMKEKTGKTKRGDSQVPRTSILRNDLLMETLLEEVRPALEQAVGAKLYPTYAYGRIYKKGDVLNRHKDRSACEVSVTLTLGSDGSTKWPICVNGMKGESKIYLNPGDALVYRGCEIEHWREPFDGEQQVQLFLHYVEQNGPNAEWRFDKRPQLGVNRSIKFKDAVNYLLLMCLQQIKRVGIVRKES
jgi:alkylated DNA repair dioxygenase AlkB